MPHDPAGFPFDPLRPPPARVPEDLARTSRLRKLDKQRKRAAARARRVQREGLVPRSLMCPLCGAPPGESCRTPSGNPLRYHADHVPRRDLARNLKARIIEEGRKATKEPS